MFLFFSNKYCFNLCNKNKSELVSGTLKSLNILSSLAGVLLSWIPISLMAVYYFYFKDWAMNIGGYKNVTVFFQPYFLLILIPITTFLISKFIWNKNILN